MYVESNLNTSFPIANGTSDGGIDSEGDGTGDANSKASSNSTTSHGASHSGSNAAPGQFSLLPLVGAFSLVAFSVIAGTL